RHNAQQLNLEIQFDHADVTQIEIKNNYDLIFFDPARRDNQGKRLFDVESYMPPLSIIQGWQAPRIMVKISPGVDLAQLEGYQGTTEFISVDGDLKEALLHLPQTAPLIATKIMGDSTQHWVNEGITIDVGLGEPHGWLCEPDASILRANLVENVAQSLDGTMLDKTIAYFCTSQYPESPWVRA